VVVYFFATQLFQNTLLYLANREKRAKQRRKSIFWLDTGMFNARTISPKILA
jgi:hypothetical protein